MESTRGIAEALLNGRRRLVARETDGERGVVLGFAAASIRLSERELSVLKAAETGIANKCVALDQSLAYSTVSECLHTAIAKLGFENRAEFLKAMAWLRRAPTGLRVVDGAELCWVFLPEALELDPRLTEAERHVVAGVLKGRSNAAIAVSRRTSSRTVANQLAAIYRKLGVSSRWELAATALRSSASASQ